ncbi:anhydro-N-acetylmuramic acid kinase [Jannaschia sp. W003]|uniref:anhydro-N-acetylmuramic acid kinase n=1 Tax=Jannaschia sp. W003 TaxID=2867012 RepID=UPI0021A4577B|nr:anhydro-N-acetylmuramic acid kinase [Jannaschia sp. W003]UWQ20422.1 anhydro-N-acetylmuramic acid kinase [Jannaschia sp. W003]
MQPIRALGTMSGTSLDGVDAAEIVTDGERIAAFGASDFRPYAPAEREVLRAALGCWPGEAGVAEAAEVVESAHARLLTRFETPDAVGFHGQTLAHAPERRRTHQAGDGAVLAEVLGVPVVWDFRTADVRLGGEGAPLAPVFHHACARHVSARRPVAFLNLGGVGNLTWVDPAEPDPGAAMLAFDTGPANAPIDDLCMDWLGEPFDRDGQLAREGEAHAALVKAVLEDPFFRRAPPKSLDRDAFRRAGAPIDALPPSHAAATWVAVVAASVARGLEHCPATPERLLVTGGGRRNPAIMAALAGAVPCAVEPVEAVGLDGDMLEAQAFGFLAVRVMRGLPTSFPRTTGVAAAVGGGQVSHPAGSVAPRVAGARHHGGRPLHGA